MYYDRFDPDPVKLETIIHHLPCLSLMHTWGGFSLKDMSKRNYNKIPLSFDNQLALMKKRGLSVGDEFLKLFFDYTNY